MVVYADILIFTNMFVNFFILKITALLGHDSPKTLRLILGCSVGSLFSLYIFLPPSGIETELIFKLIISAVIVLVTFSFISLKSFLRRIGIFFATSFLYAGFMLFIWAVIKPQNLAINNGIVYINISPVLLIILTLLGYIALSLIRYFSSKQAYLGKRCKAKFRLKNKEIWVNLLIDTGNSLTDNITGKPVFIIEKSVIKNILEYIPTTDNITEFKPEKGFRLIPYSSVGGSGLLTAFTCEKADIEYDNRVKTVLSPIIAISEEKLGEDYKGIISPTIFET